MILDGVYLDLNDEAGFEFACRQGSELGFDGKLIENLHVESAKRVVAMAEAIEKMEAQAVGA